jgi:hypothetical protein
MRFPLLFEIYSLLTANCSINFLKIKLPGFALTKNFFDFFDFVLKQFCGSSAAQTRGRDEKAPQKPFILEPNSMF